MSGWVASATPGGYVCGPFPVPAKGPVGGPHLPGSLFLAPNPETARAAAQAHADSSPAPKH